MTPCSDRVEEIISTTTGLKSEVCPLVLRVPI